MKIYVICNSLKAYHLRIKFERPDNRITYIPVARKESLQGVLLNSFYLLANDYRLNPEWFGIEEEMNNRFMQNWELK